MGQGIDQLQNQGIKFKRRQEIKFKMSKGLSNPKAKGLILKGAKGLKNPKPEEFSSKGLSTSAPQHKKHQNQLKTMEINTPVFTLLTPWCIGLASPPPTSPLPLYHWVPMCIGCPVLKFSVLFFKSQAAQRREHHSRKPSASLITESQNGRGWKGPLWVI